MKRIAIIIELKERESSFLSILKKKLEFNGYNVRLIPQRSFCGTRLLLFKPDFILINGLRSKHNFIKQILVPKILFKSKIISFYTEQVGKDGGLAKTYDNPEIFNNVDYHITWGEKFAEGLINLGINKEKIWILGSFALDLPFFQDVEKSNKIKNQTALKYGLDKKKKWILIADNIIRKNTLEKTVCIIILHYFTYIISKIYDKNSYIYFMYFYIYFILHNSIMSYTFIIIFFLYILNQTHQR